jgi:serine/threonine protein kinase
MDSLFESLYEKLNRIGRGTFGKVYKCRRRSDSAMFAVKEIDIEKDEVLQ